MKLSQFQRGYWTICDGSFINCYPTLEEAREHIAYQKEHMASKGEWKILHIKDYEFIK